MNVFISFVLFLTVCLAWLVLSFNKTADPVIEGTELIFAFMIHRHGDRTPVSSTLSFIGSSVNMTVAEELISQYGYGQLTDAGKRSGYNCGKFIRRRYDELIAPTYNKSDVYIRSTDSTRVKMTALTAMSALFPAGEHNWSPDINWTSVTYTTVPAKYDFNLPYINCPKLATAYFTLKYTDNDRMAPYANLIQNIGKIIGKDLSTHPVNNIFNVYSNYVSLKSLGYILSDDILHLMDEVAEAAGVACDILSGNDIYLPLQAGPFFNEFFKYANKTIAGTDTPKVRIYAAHDLNVYSLEAITRATPRQGTPKYASLYSLELRRVIETGQYVVLVEGCSGEFLCDYSEFLELTSWLLRDEDTWRTECGFSEHLNVDTTVID